METWDVDLPRWAKPLEPAIHLPTNNGSRIRNAIYESLRMKPPLWAKLLLLKSISEDFYKGNASGPTKDAVKAVLAELHRKIASQQSKVEIQEKHDFSVPDITLKLCRIVLRRTASLVHAEARCKLFKTTLKDPSVYDSNRVTNSPAMASNYLDFRTIDCKLAVGAYGGSHEAFLRDVQELWKSMRIEHAEQPDLIQLVDMLSKHFVSLFWKEVLDPVRNMKEYSESDFVSAEADCEVGNILRLASKMPNAVWNSGLCKVCNTDKDDDCVLLCDICDGEYHIYCLKPPLEAVPEGKWYCPFCMSLEYVAKATSNVYELREADNCEDYCGSDRSKKLGCLEEEDSSEMTEDEEFICEVCGEEGLRQAIVNCYICRDTFVHRYCFKGEFKISAKGVLWECGRCKPLNPDEHPPEKEPPICDQAVEREGAGKQKDYCPDEENNGKKNGSTVNSSDADSPAGTAEQGQSPRIQADEDQQKAKKIRI